MEIYLLYNTKQQAIDAFTWINSRDWFPADGGMTIQWLQVPEGIIETIDGKFGGQGIPSARLEENAVPQSEIDLFFSLFPPNEVRDLEATDLIQVNDEL